ncbi:hypothetical protein ACHAWF_013507 [Thalassiosira exigua]
MVGAEVGERSGSAGGGGEGPEAAGPSAKGTDGEATAESGADALDEAAEVREVPEPAPAPKPAPEPAPKPQPKPPPKPAPESPPAAEAAPPGPPGIDMAVPWCGKCQFGRMPFHCDERVKYLGRTYGTKPPAARLSIMRLGHCPEQRKENYHELAQAGLVGDPLVPAIGKIGACRHRPAPGEDVMRAFCKHCQWKDTDYNCYQRASYLVSTYGTKPAEAVRSIVAKGECVDRRSPATIAAQEAEGTERYCPACRYKTIPCRDRLDAMKYQFKILANAKKALMADKGGECEMPPYCEPPPAP